MKTKIKYLLVLVLASFVFVGCASMHESKKWEYKTIGLSNMKPDDGETELNKLGKDGWILVSVAPENIQTDLGNPTGSQHSVEGYLYVFKRPLH